MTTTLYDELIANSDAFAASVANALSMRSESFKKLFDPRRCIEDECGYPNVAAYIPSEKYQELFDRDSLAARVVEVFPREAYQVQPVVKDSEKSKDTPFTKALEALGSALAPERSYFTKAAGSRLWSLMLDAQIKSGIGRYGAALLGLNDGEDLILPAPGFQEEGSAPATRNKEGKLEYLDGPPSKHYSFTINKADGLKLAYARTFSEAKCQVGAWETNPYSPRYGRPVIYNVTLGDAYTSGYGFPISTKQVHWSRIVHLTESDEPFHTPRLQQVLNNVLAAQKPTHASAEGYWKQAFALLVLSTHPQLGGDVVFDRTRMRQEAEKLMNGLQKQMILSGFNASQLAPSVVDPQSFLDLQLMLIAVKLAIPMRVLKGTERGELASSQDDAAWNDRVKSYQNMVCTPRYVAPLVDRLINLGVLPEPKQVLCEWPDITSQTALDRVNVGKAKIEALGMYVGQNVESVLPPKDAYLELGFTDERADAILAEAVAAADSRMTEPAAPPEGQFA